MRLWKEYIRDKVQNFNPPQRDFWAYLGNDFINIYARTFTDEIGIITRENALPEASAYPEMPTYSAYRKFYFLESRHLDELSQKILLLHNSWTPPASRNMDRDELLRCDCTMSNILTEILDIDRSHVRKFTRFREYSRYSWRRFLDRKFSIRL